MSEQTPQATTRQEFEAKLIAKTWQDEAFKQQLINNPKAVYAQELGQEIPESLKIEVLEESANTVYLVLPRKPEVASVEAELSEEALEAIAGGDWGIVSKSWFIITHEPL